MVDDYRDEESRGLLPETLRKALVNGISAVFMTEEGIRNMIGDMRLPKEAISNLVQQTEKGRRELFRSVSDELKGFLQGVDVSGAMRKALTGLKVEVKAEFRFVEDGPPQSNIETQVSEVESEADETEPSPPKRKRKRARKKRSP